MNTFVWFTIALVAWVSCEASVTEANCVHGSQGSIFLPHQHHALIGHSFLNQSGTVRIKCMMLCWRHSRCLSFNHNDISGICQLNDASKEDFPDSYKQDDGFSYFGGSSNKAKPLPEETMTTKTEQNTSQDQATTTKRFSTLPMELQTETLEKTSATSALKTVCNINCLGMESGAIADHQITAKDVVNDDYAIYGPALARLNSHGSWCGKKYTSTFIQVEFTYTVDTCSLIIQGRYGSDEHVTSFNLKYIESYGTWMYMGSYPYKIYIAEMMPGSQFVNVSVQISSAHKMIRSRSIRIYPLTWNGNYPCMRFELISCN